MIDADIVNIYRKLSKRYPLILTSSLAEGFNTTLDFPVLKGSSSLGSFEMFPDDLPSFEFYAMHDNGELAIHMHFYSFTEAEQAVADFMEGRLYVVSFKLEYDTEPIESTPQKAISFHRMKLHSSPFEKIKSGEKTIELRLYDEKRQQINTGDSIVFTNTATGETLTATVKKLHRFDSFEELYQTLPLLQCGYTAEDIDSASPADMESYYSKEEQAKYGVVGIELTL